MNPALVLDQITASYAGGRVIALQDLSLTVVPGEVFALRGNNGAGKSTVLKILAGLLRPAAGSARIFGVDVGVAEARRSVGFVPEMPALPPQLTPLEILETGLLIHQGSLPKARQHSLDWLDKLGLSAVAERRVGGFSKGMLQRVSLAHALAIRPKLLVLDEPLSGLDTQARQQVVDLLFEFKRAGGSMLLISHVADDVERLADRDGILIEGKWQPAKTQPA